MRDATIIELETLTEFGVKAMFDTETTSYRQTGISAYDAAQTRVHDVTTSEAIDAAYAPGESFVNSKQRRCLCRWTLYIYAHSCHGFQSNGWGLQLYLRKQVSETFLAPASWGKIDCSVKAVQNGTQFLSL
jgi:hypothetical protein